MLKTIDKDKPLPGHTKVDCYECYAKIVLEEMFPETFHGLVISDKPDLQNKQLNIGVEVTSSEEPEQRKTEMLYAKLPEQDRKGTERIEKQIEKCGAKIDGGFLIYSFKRDNSDQKRDYFKQIYEVLEKKMKKFGGYETFIKQYLFIFSDICATPVMRNDALIKMHNICSSANQIIEGIFIYVPGAIYVFNLADNITYERKIASDMQYTQACNARKMVIQEEGTMK